ncbi:MAG: YceD family protein [Candidatus Contendobacter sp.]|nr:YceD family protein [Candidatus Contendobacter sp.]MDG4556742.1 YceD family protein [Candidatus Contendobacter sp.]
MWAPSLPNKVDPWRLAAESGRLNGALTLATLPRLAAVLNRADGVANVALLAGVDQRGVRFIEGTVRTEVELICQRCLGVLRLPLEAVVSLGLARNEAEADRLPEEYEPLLVAEGVIGVADLVEDELLLALPLIPRHEDARDCQADGYRTPAGGEHDPPSATWASLLRDFPRSH